MAQWLDSFVQKYRSNRRMLLSIVYVALFLDNMLLTTVVPIIPEYLLRLQHPNSTDMLLNNVFSEQELAAPPATPFPPSDKVRVKRQTIGWDSAEWENSLKNDETEQKKPRRFKGKALVAGGMRGGRVRTTMPPPLDMDDDYEALPDEFSIESPIDELDLPSDRSKSMGRRRTSKRPNSTTSSQSSAERQQIAAAAFREVRHRTLTEENVHVGLMFGSKALVQLLANPLVGPLTNKIGYTMPMFAGFVIMFLSTLLFAFGTSFITLWLARSLQGIGSACTSTSGMGMLAQAYPDDAERGSAMGIALGGLALGVLVGPPYGGMLYQWAGKELPFILLALLALLDGSLQFLLLQPKVDRGEPEGTAIKELARDPYIIVAAGSITIGNLGIAMLEPSLPLWMMESWSANSIERGAAFLPASISYLIGTNIFGPLAYKIGRWLSSFIGLIVIGFCLIAIPSASSVFGLILPNFCMGFSIGMIDASMFPMMGHIVDQRHVGVYGSIYAIADAAFCFAFFLGPFFSGPLVRTVGFPTMMYMIAVVNFCYAPLMFFLRVLPAKVPEEQAIVVHADVSSGGRPPLVQRQQSVVRHHLYEKIEGAVDFQLDTGAAATSARNSHYNGYNFSSVWED
uniref:MFS domain-containing protein n=1 Tax=Globodera pallida TaxID=36090 RepID=A0A183C103_GLOPA